MKRSYRILAALLSVWMLAALCLPCSAAGGEYSGKTVILHTNDVHGSVEGYAYVAGLREEFTDKGAQVITVDAGDFSQGTSYVSVSKGENAVLMMNAAGYDFASPGNHEFDYGREQLNTNAAKADFGLLCSNVLDENGKALFTEREIFVTDSGVKIGFFGLETPEALTKANPAYTKGLTILSGEALYANARLQVEALAGADIVICLSHLGVDPASKPNTSYDLYGAVRGIDLIIDGHSHTEMTEGEKKEPIQSTGSSFENIGVIVIDDKTKRIEDHYLMGVDETLPRDADVQAAADKIVSGIREQYGQVFASCSVDLNGEKAPGNRTGETNLGDLLTDAMLWAALRHEDSLSVPAERVVAVTNGGGIRAWIRRGDITKNDVNNVLPFGNTLTVVYMTGAQLLEALEASTYCTPDAVGGFPQTAGMEYSIDTTLPYEPQAQTYPDSTYYGPAAIRRVTVDSVNGKPFDTEAVYAVATNDFCAAGGDTYYAFASAEERFDTGLPLDEVLMDYITSECGGTVGSEYKTAQDRIRIRLGFGDRIKAFFLNVWSSVKNFFTGLVYKAGAFFSSLFGKNG